MRLDFFMLADSAKLGDYGKLDIIGGAITFVELPTAPGAAAGISAVARLIVEPHDRELSHAVRVRLTAPTGNVLFESPLSEVSAELVNAPHEPDEEVAIVFVGTLAPATFPDYGTYRFTFELDGTDIAARALDVRPVPTDREAEAPG